jgi:hypothetical protein
LGEHIKIIDFSEFVVNEWNNLSDKDYGIVFTEHNEKLKVLGMQNYESTKRGVSSIIKIDEPHTKVCKHFGWDLVKK